MRSTQCTSSWYVFSCNSVVINLVSTETVMTSVRVRASDVQYILWVAAVARA